MKPYTGKVLWVDLTAGTTWQDLAAASGLPDETLAGLQAILHEADIKAGVN